MLRDLFYILFDNLTIIFFLLSPLSQHRHCRSEVVFQFNLEALGDFSVSTCGSFMWSAFSALSTKSSFSNDTAILIKILMCCYTKKQGVP